MSISDASDVQELTACSYDPCRCTLMGAVVGSSYCSDYCEQADTDSLEEDDCACGHPPCDAPQ